MVNDIGNDCLDMKEVTVFTFLFENDSLKIGGVIKMNCNPQNYLFEK